MKFVIFSRPQTSGGGIVLHALCKYLSEEGHDAKMLKSFGCHRDYHGKFWPTLKQRVLYLLKFTADLVAMLIIGILTKLHIGGGLSKYRKLRRYFYFSVKGCKRKWLPFISDDTIIVYPDIVYGNVFRAKNVVRWLLWFNRFPNDDAAYGKNDLFFSFSQKFNDPKINPSYRLCTISYFDWNLYKRTNFGERHGTCYIIRKGKTRSDLPEKFDGVIIDDLPEDKKVQQFNKCKYCVSYDLYTAYSSIAAMLGCISIVVPEPGKTRYDYGSTPRYGIAFGFDETEIQFAQTTLDKLAELFDATEQQNRENIKYFIEECRKHFHME